MPLLFPEPTECRRRLGDFSEKWPENVRLLNEIHRKITDAIDQDVQQKRQILSDINRDVLGLLQRWSAFRGGGRKNENFLPDVVAVDGGVNVEIIYEIARTTNEHEDSLGEILNERQDGIKKVYNCFREKLLLNNPRARIVAISKALLIICGFSVGFDTERVNKAINNSKIEAFAAPGVWPFWMYFGNLKAVAEEQTRWESRYNERMCDLLTGTPIGQIMDRILWTS